MQYDAAFPPKDFFCLNWKNLRRWGGLFIFLKYKDTTQLEILPLCLKDFFFFSRQIQSVHV